MSAIRFHAVVGPDGVIHPPVGVKLPQGDVEVSVRSQLNDRTDDEERLRRLCVRRGLNPDGLDEITRSILMDELSYEDRGSVRPRPQPGAMKGSILYISPDFDAPLEDMKEYME